MLDLNNISIIVQGNITSKEIINSCLTSIRRLLPNSEIILSTYVGFEYYDLDYDILVLSEDPGAELIDEKNKVYNNINRQILTTREGLKKATREYVLKFRTDITLDGISWLNYFGKYDDEFSSTYFENRVLVCNFYTRNPRVLPIPFHPSDWIMFGRRKDVLKYFDIPFQSKEEILWFSNHEKKTAVFSHMLSKFAPEQYFCIHCFEKLNFNSYYDNTIENVIRTERFFAENFVILDYKRQLKITFLKYNPNRYYERYSLLNYSDWLELYRNYCLKPSEFFWNKYLFKCKIKFFIFNICRKILIKCLDFLHLKEIVKKFLRRE